ncbi:MAG: Ig-like domain-containing protein, partial [Verrucomicrobiaceae bacterium]
MNDQPVVARANANVTVNEGSPAANTGTFNDADGNATATLTASIGSITQNNAAGTWSWSYTPPDSKDQPQTVTITATDNGTTPLVNMTTFGLTVTNVAPTIALSGNSSVSQSTGYTLNLGAVTDPGTDTVASYSIDWGDGITENFSGSPGSRTKTHVYATTGNKTISVSITDEDGTFAAAGTKTISVVNDSPTVTRDDAIRTVNEGSLITNAGTYSDMQGASTITLTASVGTITAVPSTQLIADTTTGGKWRTSSVIKPLDIDGNDVYGTDGYSMWGLNGVQTEVNPSYANVTRNAALSFFPGNGGYFSIDDPLNPSGSQQLTGVIYDAPGGSNATTFFTSTFTQARNVRMGILVDNTDFAAISPSTLRLRQIAGGASDSGYLAAGNPVTRNRSLDYYFFDIQAQAGDVYEVSGNNDPGFGSNGIGGVFFDTGTAASGTSTGTWSWSYTPTDGPDASQTVTITADDGVNPVVTTTFALTVNNVAPTALAQSVATNEDTAKDITLAASDPGADTQTFSIVNGPTPAQGTLSAIAGNQVTFTPALNFNGSASFTFKATDSDGADSNTATVSITVSPVNDQPAVATDNATVITNEGSLASNTGTFNDIEGNATATVTASIGTVTQNNVAGTWSWNYTPGDGPDNSQTVTITANDGVNAPVNTTFALTVNNVAPAALAQTVTTIEDTAKLITLGANDPGSDTQTFSIVTGPTPAQGTLSTISGNQVTFTPAPNFNGPASFTFEAMDSDGASSNTATVNITVDSANDQPTITRTNAAVTTDEGSLVSNTGTFGDADGTATTTLTASIGALAQNNTTGTWSWSYTPSDGPDDSQTVTITATDNGSPALVSTATFALTVNNAAPTALAQTVTVTEDMAKLITL